MPFDDWIAGWDRLVQPLIDARPHVTLVIRALGRNCPLVKDDANKKKFCFDVVWPRPITKGAWIPIGDASLVYTIMYNNKEADNARHLWSHVIVVDADVLEEQAWADLATRIQQWRLPGEENVSLTLIGCPALEYAPGWRVGRLLLAPNVTAAVLPELHLPLSISLVAMIKAVIARLHEKQHRLMPGQPSRDEKKNGGPAHRFFSHHHRLKAELEADKRNEGACPGIHTCAAECAVFQRRQSYREFVYSKEKMWPWHFADDPWWRLDPVLLDPIQGRMELLQAMDPRKAGIVPLNINKAAMATMARDELLFILDLMMRTPSLRINVNGLLPDETLASVWIGFLEKPHARPTRHYMTGDV